MTETLVYVDTDIGLGTPGAEIDDAAAMMVLMSSPQVNLLGAGSVFGNVPGDDALANLCRMQSFFGRRELKIGRGADLPLVEGVSWFSGWQAEYGPTLPFPVPASLPASAQLMIDLVRMNPHQVTILSIGPMTNLAIAARLAPDFVPLVRQVIAMGGSFGEDQAAPEFNIHSDPEAAHIVFTAGWKLRLIGLNITRQVKFTRQEFASLKGSHPATRLLREMAPRWIDRVEGMGWEQGGCGLHDAVAAASLIDPSLLQFRLTRVRVELHDLSRRGLVYFEEADRSLPQAEVAVQIDVQACHDRIWSLIQGCEE